MPKIQIDMFEVQLGAGVLIQLTDLNGEPVRILADAGVEASGYSSDHVLRKLPNSFRNFDSSGKYRIDLMVGTHYDKDHLEGLVDIVSDPNIEVKQAWLPPIANDVDNDGEESEIEESDLLAFQFASEIGGQIYNEYINFHLKLCREALSIENEIIAVVHKIDSLSSPEWDDFRESYRERYRVLLEEQDIEEDLLTSQFQHDDMESIQRHFENHRDSAIRRLPRKFQGGHADAQIAAEDDEDIGDEIEAANYQSLIRYSRGYTMMADSQRIRRKVLSSSRRSPAAASLMLKRAALIRKSSATNAINATSLNKLVRALNKKNIQIRAESIHAGQPEYYLWNAANKSSFGKVSEPIYKNSAGPKITLLGPSKGLIRKHRKRLPVGTYFATMEAAFLRRLIPLKSITPSNQLSYIFKITSDEQNILVTGDAGCVDFKRKNNRKYYSNLIDSLDELQVVQVAHHAGNNSHFYRVLLNSGFGVNTQTRSHLLLSHATADKYRPSKVFGQFVDQLENNGVLFDLLFTSKPMASKVKGFRHLVSPAVGTISDRGDIRLTYDGKIWTVDKHAIQI